MKNNNLKFLIIGIFAVIFLISASLHLVSAFVDADCDSGTLADDCILNHTYFIINDEQINGTGNFIIGTNGSVYNSSGISFGINFTSGNIVLLAGGNISADGNNSASAPKTGSNITILAGSFNLSVGTSIYSAGGSLTASVAATAGRGGLINITANTIILEGTINISGGNHVGSTSSGNGGNGGILQINTNSDLIINGNITGIGGTADTDTATYTRGSGGIIIVNNYLVNLTINSSIDLNKGNSGRINDGIWSNSVLIANNILFDTRADTKIQATINATNTLTIKGILGGDGSDSSLNFANYGGNLTIYANLINLTSTGKLKSAGGKLSASLGSPYLAGTGGLINISVNNFIFDGDINVSGGNHVGTTNNGAGGDAGTLQINILNNLTINGNIYGVGGDGDSDTCSAPSGNRGDGGILLLVMPNYDLIINKSLFMNLGANCRCNSGAWQTSTITARNISIESSAYVRLNGTINATDTLTIKGNLTGDGFTSDSGNSAQAYSSNGGNLNIYAVNLNLTLSGTLSSNGGSLTSSVAYYAGAGGIINITATKVIADGNISFNGGNHVGSTNSGSGGDGGTIWINTPNNLAINGYIFALGGTSDTNTYTGTNGIRGNGGNIILFAQNVTLSKRINQSRGFIGAGTNGLGGNLTIISTGVINITTNISQLGVGTSAYPNGTISLTYVDDMFLKGSIFTEGPLITRNASFGKIEMLNKTSSYAIINYSEAIKIAFNNISVDTNINPQLNNSAVITFYTITEAHIPKLLTQGFKNGKICPNPACTNITNFSSSVYTFNVTGFSDYSLIDFNSPNIILNTPANASYANATSQNLTANLTDDAAGIKNATIYIYNSTTLYNQTVAIINAAAGTLTQTIGVVVSLIDGIYTWFYELFDFAGNSFLSSNSTLTVDTTLPIPIFVTPTPANYSGKTGNFEINVSITEVNLANITFSFSGQADIICNRTSTSLSNSFSCNNTNATIYNITSEVYVFLFNKSGLVAGTSYYYNLTAFDFANNQNMSAPRIIRGNAAPSFISAVQNTYVNNSIDPGVGLTITANVSDGEYNLGKVLLQWRNTSQDWGINNITMVNMTDMPTDSNQFVYTLLNATLTLPSYEGTIYYRIWANDTIGETSNSSQYIISNRWDCTWSISATSLDSVGGFNQEKVLGNLSLNNTGDIQYTTNNCTINFARNVAGGAWYDGSSGYESDGQYLNISAEYYLKTGTKGLRYYSNGSSVNNITLAANSSTNLQINGHFVRSTSVLTEAPYLVVASNINDTETGVYNATITMRMVITPGAYLETAFEPTSQTVYLTPGNFSIAAYTKNVVDAADNPQNNTAYNVTHNITVPSALISLLATGELNRTFEIINTTAKNVSNLTFTLTAANIVDLAISTYTFNTSTYGYENSSGSFALIVHTNNKTTLSSTGTVTFACYSVEDDVCVAACVNNTSGLVLDPDCSVTTTTVTTTTTTTSGGGGGGSGGGGGGSVIKTEATFELLRGAEEGFSFAYKNRYPTPMSKLKFQLSGINSEYISYSPKEVSYLGAGKETDMKIKINAPVYFSGKSYTLILDIEGYVGEEGTQTKFNEKKYITLNIVEVPRSEIEKYLNSSLDYIEEMNNSGMNTDSINELFNKFNSAYTSVDFGTAKTIYGNIKQVYDSAIESKKIIAELEKSIAEAERNGISVIESKRLLYIAEAAFDRGDYLLALERLKQARLSFVSETKGEFNLAYAIKNNPIQAFGILLGLGLVGLGSSVAIRYFLYKQKLKMLKEEQELLLGLMKVIQKECFESNHMSMEEYREAMNQYENKLSEVIEDKIRIETKLLNILKFKGKDKALHEEKKRLLKMMQETQNDYLNKGKLETRVYENMIKTYNARLTEVEEQLAFIEAEEAIGRDKKVRKMFKVEQAEKRKK